jgi:hypothetical protein
MTIEFYRKNKYGKELYFINDPKIRIIFFQITGQLSLTIFKMQAFEKLGFEFYEVLPPINL